MKTITITEANHKFTRMTDLVDEERCVALTKHGKAAYVIQTKEEYDKTQLLADGRCSALYETLPEETEPLLSLAENKITDLTISKIEKTGEDVKIIELSITDGKEDFLTTTKCKVSDITCTGEEITEVFIPIRPGVTVAGFDAEYISPEDAEFMRLSEKGAAEIKRDIRSLMDVYRETPMRKFGKPFRVTSKRQR